MTVSACYLLVPEIKPTLNTTERRRVPSTWATKRQSAKLGAFVMRLGDDSGFPPTTEMS